MFDTTVLMFGTRVESMLMERDKRGKPVHDIIDLLKPYSATTPTTHTEYQALGGRVARKVKIKPDGTWDE